MIKKLALKLAMSLLRFSMSKVSKAESKTINTAFSRSNTGIIGLKLRAIDLKKGKLHRFIAEFIYVDPVDMTIRLDLGRHLTNTDIEKNNIELMQLPTHDRPVKQLQKFKAAALIDRNGRYVKRQEMLNKRMDEKIKAYNKAEKDLQNQFNKNEKQRKKLKKA